MIIWNDAGSIYSFVTIAIGMRWKTETRVN